MSDSQRQPGSAAIVNVRVFDGREMTEAVGLRIKNGMIEGLLSQQDAARVEADQVVDGQGGTLLPGLIDAHAHIDRPAQLQAAARWGVTSMIDMGTPPEKLKAVLADMPGVAQVPVAPGWAGAPPDGVHARMLHVPAIRSVEDAERMVEDRAAAGVGFIKAIVDSPGQNGMVFLDGDALTAMVKTAHAHDLMVVGHITTNRALDLSLRAGMDIMTHVPFGEVLSWELTTRMRDQNMKSIPTLYIAETMIEAMPPQVRAARGADYLKASRSVTALREAGILIAAGTDAAEGVPGVPPNMPHGKAMHRELKLLTEAGFSPVEALRAATGKSAGLFHLKDRGVLEAGRRADLLLVRGDPTRDIDASRDILGVWLEGARLESGSAA